MPIIMADDGARLNVTSTGGGPLTAVFLHNMGGNIATWEPLWAAMDTTRVRCLALDLRGTGDSEREPCELTNERLARDILQLADHYNAESFVVIGHSLGAKLGLFLTTAAPERVRALGLLGCPSPGFVPIERKVLEEYLAQTNRRAYAEAFYRPWFNVWPRPRIDAYLDSFARMPDWAVLASCELSLWTDFRDRLSVLSCPALVMGGEYDPVYGPVYQQQEVLPYVPDAEVVTVPLGHGFMLERAADVAAPLDAFLARLS
jgi:3-oxoadipate enol-lactonase